MRNKIEMSMDREETSKTISGVSPKVMGIYNGQKVMIKCSAGCPVESLAELFAFRLGTELGLRVNEVEITSEGKLFNLDRICSIHKWEDDFVISSKYENNQSHQDKQILSFFDSLLDNDDRNHANFGYINDELFLIDHGFAGPWNMVGPYERRNLEKTFSSISEVVEKFLSLEEEDFWEMTELPDEFKLDFHERYINQIVLRMIEAQLIIKGELVVC